MTEFATEAQRRHDEPTSSAPIPLGTGAGYKRVPGEHLRTALPFRRGGVEESTKGGLN
jgi:hypothetical protein